MQKPACFDFNVQSLHNKDNIRLTYPVGQLKLNRNWPNAVLEIEPSLPREMQIFFYMMFVQLTSKISFLSSLVCTIYLLQNYMSLIISSNFSCISSLSIVYLIVARSNAFYKILILFCKTWLNQPILLPVKFILPYRIIIIPDNLYQ